MLLITAYIMYKLYKTQRQILLTGIIFEISVTQILINVVNQENKKSFFLSVFNKVVLFT